MEEEITQSLKILQDGGVILYPTDTIWGLGCDATNPDAIQKIYNIKQRKESKALITLVSDKKMLKKLTDSVPDTDITSDPTTVIYQNIEGLSDNLLAEDGTAAIRIVQDNFCKQLIEIFGKAIVSTSANISGTKSPKQFSDITDDIINNADYIVNLRKKERRENSSRIIKIEKNGSITKLR
ncbi:MAG: Sua5/YciO/YrdC/YwlC family protein [Flavobacteriales bacterium]|jgi:L-threonylcarbamoyladenylate synthase|nr:Sua5/YciO/YrdC/YwlC family protein [Flavobacteriales bacterium]MBT4737746.1 Sua5/YciO/YrdC/YwlC family protein [Flavobacteriales bacterium]MBT5354936.1 Sua5/YciO/YrdC/YwlC family protein [Flavobacteriales bacterium]MBT5699439.1 Sua5/YciO/YrdC/YwlC family protein [Flavobacteriales bacterium]MBT6699175.1 Sua5/YciO/YrdC/YwlC family protein [Flavobacteriales bacterium]